MFCVLKPKLCVNERFYSHFSKYANVSMCCWQTANTRLTPFGPIACSVPGFPVLPSLPEFAQTRVCGVSDAIPPSHPLLSPSPIFNLSHHQGLFQWVRSLHQVVKLLDTIMDTNIHYSLSLVSLWMCFIEILYISRHWNQHLLIIYSSIGNALAVWLFKNKCQWKK